MSSLDARIALQMSRFDLIQEAASYDDTDVPEVNRHLIVTRLELLEQNWTRFRDEHENMCLSESEALSNLQYVRERIYERCQAFYVFSRAKLLTQRDDVDGVDRRSRTASLERGTVTSAIPRNALPRIKIPAFSGEYHVWRTFHDLFTSMIKDNADLSEVEKMHYLKACVTGEAARLINNLPVSSENFRAAWKILVTRYENKRYLLDAQMDMITDMKPLKTKSAQGLKALLTTTSEAIGAIQALGYPVHHWDPIILHLLVKLLDPETRETWELKLGSTSAYPTFAQLEDFLVARINALEKLNLHSSGHGSNKTHSNGVTGKLHSKIAAHVATPTQSSVNTPCPLCGSAHYLARCERYQAKTMRQRRDYISQQRRCFNCLGPHVASKCSSTKRCIKCGKKHHSSIHEASSTNAKFSVDPQSKTAAVQSAEPSQPSLQ